MDKLSRKTYIIDYYITRQKQTNTWTSALQISTLNATTADNRKITYTYSHTALE